MPYFMVTLVPTYSLLKKFPRKQEIVRAECKQAMYAPNNPQLLIVFAVSIVNSR